MRLPWLVSDLHPHALSLTEDALGDDFAPALVDDLADMNPPDIIERFRCVFPEGPATDVLMAAGFSAVRLTRLLDLNVTIADHPALAANPPGHLAPHWFKSDERAPWKNWLAAHWRHYCATHASNPPREPVRGVRTIFIGNDLVEGFALRDGPQGRVRAFGSLRNGNELGWIGGAPTLIAPTLAACLRRATALGWTKATLEVDDDDAALWALADRLGVAPAQTFVTWQLERDPAKRPN